MAARSPDKEEPFYTREQLDSPAQPIADFDLALALLATIPSRWLLEFWIDKHGDVRQVLWIEPAREPENGQAVIASLRRIPFSPAKRNGDAVNSRKLVELAIDGPEMLTAR